MDAKILDTIRQLPKPAVVAVLGFGGAGKSTTARKLGEALGAPVVGVDSFILNRLSSGTNWESVDWKRFEEEVLASFSRGENPIRYGEYDWAKDMVGETREAKHDGLLIVEGIGLLRPELNDYFAYKIWVDVPLEVAIERGKKRDREYGNDHDALWDGIWKENDQSYFDTYDPKSLADAVIQNESS